jgi:type I restriction enzyme S subunit
MSEKWITSLMGDVVEVAAGQPAPQGSDQFTHCGPPFVRAGSLGYLVTGGDEDDLEHIDNEAARKFGLRLFPTGTVLFAKSGMSALNGFVHCLTKPCYVVSHLAALVPRSSLVPTYLAYWLRSNPPSRLIGNSAYPSIRLSQIAHLKIEHPRTVIEQRHIVAILDKANTIRRKRRDAIRLIDELLRSTFLDLFGDPITNPMNWPMGPIGDLAAAVQYGTSAKAGSTGAFKILRMGNITYEGGWDFSDMKFIDLAPDEVQRYSVNKGEVLFNRTNSRELVGKTAVFREEEPMIYAGYLVKLTVNDRADGEYVGAVMNTRSMKAYLRAKCKNIIGMANINASEFKAIPVPIPPIKLQKKFASIVHKTLRARERLTSALQEADKLFSAIESRAFKGAL